MRLRRSRLKTYSHRRAVIERDSEGCSNVRYADPVEFEAEMWTAGGKLQAEMYGIRLPNIRNLRIQGKYKEITVDGVLYFEIENGPRITVNDGICLNVPPETDPDYRVIAIRPYSFLTLEVEKRGYTSIG
ncbi:MAG: hypothetical protein Q4C58_14265 [Eubacteriales bacterium]|nr:hypothetical protein [Eubacteriales bacterium]